MGGIIRQPTTGGKATAINTTVVTGDATAATQVLTATAAKKAHWAAAAAGPTVSSVKATATTTIPATGTLATVMRIPLTVGVYVLFVQVGVQCTVATTVAGFYTAWSPTASMTLHSPNYGVQWTPSLATPATTQTSIVQTAYLIVNAAGTLLVKVGAWNTHAGKIVANDTVCTIIKVS